MVARWPAAPSEDTAKDQSRGLARTAASDGRPMHPAVPVAALGARLPPDAVVVTDSGHNTGLAARYIALQPGHDFAVSGLLASMACGLPYAIAAALSFPGRPVLPVSWSAPASRRWTVLVRSC